MMNFFFSFRTVCRGLCDKFGINHPTISNYSLSSQKGSYRRRWNPTRIILEVGGPINIKKKRYCFDHLNVQSYLQHKKIKSDTPKTQMKLHLWQPLSFLPIANQANNDNPPNPPSITNPSQPISTPASANNNLSQNNPAWANSEVPTPAEAGAVVSTSKNTMPTNTSREDFTTPLPTDANYVSVTPSTAGNAHVHVALLPSPVSTTAPENK